MSESKQSFDPIRLGIALDALEEQGFYDEVQVLRQMVADERLRQLMDRIMQHLNNEI